MSRQEGEEMLNTSWQIITSLNSMLIQAGTMIRRGIAVVYGLEKRKKGGQ
jgi:hypothetical protein